MTFFARLLNQITIILYTSPYNRAGISREIPRSSRMPYNLSWNLSEMYAVAGLLSRRNLTSLCVERSWLAPSPTQRKPLLSAAGKGERGGAERCVGWIHDVKKGAKRYGILLPDCANPMIVGGNVSVSSRRNTTTDGPKPNGTFLLAEAGEGKGLEFQKAKGRPSDVICTFPLEETGSRLVCACVCKR